MQSNSGSGPHYPHQAWPRLVKIQTFRAGEITRNYQNTKIIRSLEIKTIMKSFWNKIFLRQLRLPIQRKSHHITRENHDQGFAQLYLYKDLARIFSQFCFNTKKDSRSQNVAKYYCRSVKLNIPRLVRITFILSKYGSWVYHTVESFSSQIKHKMLQPNN